MILIVGNIISGLSFVGPFETIEEALLFTQKKKIQEWVFAEIVVPDKYGEEDDQG